MSAEKQFVFISIFFIHSIVFRQFLPSVTENPVHYEFGRSGDDILQKTAQKYSELSRTAKKDLGDLFKLQITELDNSFQRICQAFKSPLFHQISGCELADPCELAEKFNNISCSKVEQKELENFGDYGFELLQTLFNFRSVETTNDNPYTYMAKLLTYRKDFDFKGIFPIENVIKKRKEVFDAFDSLSKEFKYEKLVIGIVVDFLAFASYNKQCLDNAKSFDLQEIGSVCAYLTDSEEYVQIRRNNFLSDKRPNHGSNVLFKKTSNEVLNCEFGQNFVKKIYLAVIECVMIITLAKTNFSTTVLNSISDIHTYLSIGQFLMILAFAAKPKIPFILRISSVILPKVIWNCVFGCGCKLKMIISAWKSYPKIQNISGKRNENNNALRIIKTKRKKKRRPQL